MLGPVGPLLKAALESKGFQITRPSAIERELCRSPVATWFSSDMGRLARVYDSNRALLAKVSDWTDKAALDASLWRYGVPEIWERGERETGSTRLNEIEREITYTDLIAFLASQFDDLRYLEIGVSVGKNFAQVRHSVPGEYTALDVEAPNPPLLEAMGVDLMTGAPQATQTVETLSGVSREVQLVRHSGDNVTYIQGDQFDNKTWLAMKDRKFNFIFSDGVHSPRALRDELDHLFDANLLDLRSPRFVMYWDDMVDQPMQAAFVECAKRLQEQFNGGSYGLHWIHGTYGLKRLNGIFEFQAT
jgi:hypothetical protein